MSWETLADEIQTKIEEQGKEFVKEQGDIWKDFAKDLAQDYAKQVWAVKTSKNEAERELAKEAIKDLEAQLATRIALSQLEFINEGGEALTKILGVAMRFGSKVLMGLLL